MKWDELSEQPCLISRSLAVIGDRWTLLILRELFFGVRRFDVIKENLGISRTVVAERLSVLVEEGVLRKEAYCERPLRHEYRLTRKGLDLYPILLTLFDWSRKHYPVEEGLPVIHVHRSCGKPTTPLLTCSECGEELTARNVEARPGPGHRPLTELRLRTH
ncbi:helix-turn-helix domain-containing protein [Alteriqipengyuania flavescens]|uniref:winged helix-turn-helix transcriptional regulator n=1 Tax=Alteriqipengyuania flavescens TaxID=3053610 RepID=UPI0025B4CDF3|nr:helix-turn-helix domain-containing protein [Alteriqipengyuania flavescens]WJY19935.1 helix-turn-helix domain-containing protein [Alteriqipengyuania flavescens]WJY25879.1 helix-turn-helix domain-containing protein [Alteriqipengyuania flavescens]